jgi:hypothetical protein
MNDLERSDARVPAVLDPEDEPRRGPSLVLLYSLIALALVVALGLAGLIVLPFYRRL